MIGQCLKKIKFTAHIFLYINKSLNSIMKNFYALLLSVAVSTGLMAQSYYVLPALNAGMNPGDINKDVEYPQGGGAAPGWSVLMAGTTTDQWSSAQTIPFAFNFDGSPVTSFLVSNNGVITFSASPTGTIPATNAALPNGLLPDNSVCVWGLNISGVGSDNIVSKVFGTAPNRQLWVQWSSASGGGLPANGWTYWSIVLEESSDNIYVVDQRTGNGVTALTVGVQVSTTNTTQVNGSPAVASLAGTDPNPSDNSYYEFIYGTQMLDDMMGIRGDMPSVVKTGTAVNIGGYFRNLGASQLGGADFNYTINGGSVTKAPAAGISNLTSGIFATLTSPTAFTPAADGVYEVKMWLSNLNGNADGDMSNDTISTTLVATATVPERKVVIEEKTGAWCQWCPRGTVGMEYMGLTYPNSAIPIAVHNGDPMVVAEYDGNIGTVAPGGYPGSSVDRVLGPDPNVNELESAYNQRRDVIPAATVAIDGVFETGGNITVDVSVNFIAPMNNIDYRLAAVVLESGIIGTDASYNQSNAYSGGGQGPMAMINGVDFAAAASSVPFGDMVYDHVARSIEPGFFGEANSIPGTITQGQTVSHQMQFSLPSSVMDVTKCEVAILLLNNANYEIVNADKAHMWGDVSVKESAILNTNIYPNPANDFVTVKLNDLQDFNVQVVNAIGEVVMNVDYTNIDRAVLNTASLAAGVYVINVASGNKTSSQRIAIK